MAASDHDAFDGTLSSWWARIAIGLLLFVSVCCNVCSACAGAGLER
ncbi:hypothetical protein [Lysobacter gummosus]